MIFLTSSERPGSPPNSKIHRKYDLEQSNIFCDVTHTSETIPFLTSTHVPCMPTTFLKLPSVTAISLHFPCVTVWGRWQMDAKPLPINDDCMAPPLRSMLASYFATHIMGMIRAERHIEAICITIFTARAYTHTSARLLRRRPVAHCTIRPWLTDIG